MSHGGSRFYRVELEGFNDGVPYEMSRHADIISARRSLEDRRRSNPKVKYRLISIIEDWK